MTPKNLLAMFPETLLTIDSTVDARKKNLRGKLLIDDPTFNPDTVAMRYEEDRGLLFVDAAWMATLTDDDNLPLQETLQKNLQYRGKASIRMLKGTGYIAAPVDVHVYDLMLANAQRVMGQPTTKRVATRNRLLKENQGDVAAVAKAMEVIDALDPLIVDKTIDKESMKYLLGEAKKMLNEAKRIASGMKPMKREKKPRVHLAALDQFILESKQLEVIDVKQTRLVVEAGVPYLTDKDIIPTVSEESLRGLFKEHINLNGTNHTKRLYLKISELRKHVPNYRHDFRYVTSHCTYVRYREAAEQNQTHKNTTLYCAVFDMLRSKPRETS